MAMNGEYQYHQGESMKATCRRVQGCNGPLRFIVDEKGISRQQ